MLTLIAKIREDYRRMFPGDFVNYGKLTEVLHSLAWKIKEEEDKNEKSTNESIQTAQ